MYFLRLAWQGMQRRLLTSLLTASASAALLISVSAISLWAYWLGWQQHNLRANRTAAVFVNTVDDKQVDEVYQRIKNIANVESARVVSVDEFTLYLKQHFPDLADALSGLGVDVIPRMLEVTFLPNSSDEENPAQRQQVLRDISVLPNVLRVDDGLERITKALDSLRWLSFSGVVLAIALWCVLLIICLGHYQGILFTELLEVQLMRSLGATKLWIILPWFIEALIHSAICCILVLFGLIFGKSLIADMFNQFFGTFGYEPFLVDWGILLPVSILVFVAAAGAHGLGAVLAMVRGRIR